MNNLNIKMRVTCPCLWRMKEFGLPESGSLDTCDCVDSNTLPTTFLSCNIISENVSSLNYFVHFMITI